MCMTCEPVSGGWVRTSILNYHGKCGADVSVRACEGGGGGGGDGIALDFATVRMSVWWFSWVPKIIKLTELAYWDLSFRFQFQNNVVLQSSGKDAHAPYVSWSQLLTYHGLNVVHFTEHKLIAQHVTQPTYSCGSAAGDDKVPVAARLLRDLSKCLPHCIRLFDGFASSLVLASSWINTPFTATAGDISTRASKATRKTRGMRFIYNLNKSRTSSWWLLHKRGSCRSQRLWLWHARHETDGGEVKRLRYVSKYGPLFLHAVQFWTFLVLRVPRWQFSAFT